MATTSITFLPRLDLAQTSALEEGKIANLMSDVISLLLTMDTAICDLCGFSDPINHAEVFILWAEACVVIANTFRFLQPLYYRLLSTTLTGDVTAHPLPHNRYLRVAEVTFEGLRDHLTLVWTIFSTRLDTWSTVFDDLIHVQSNLVDYSSRALPEIVMEAILLTRKPRVAKPSKKEVEDWLCLLPSAKSASPRCLNLHLTRLNTPEIFKLLNLNFSNVVPRLGTVACVSAVYTHPDKGNNTLSTGSTLIRWGTILGALRVGQGNLTLHTWFREQRQARFSPPKQAFADKIVGRYRDGFEVEMKKVFHGYTERDWVALPHGREKADLKKELRPAKTRAVNNLGKDILGTAGNAIIDKFTRQATGLAYSGQTFAIKARCPACKLLYRFRWPAGAPPDEAPEDQAVAEVDVNRAEAPCGCCAEALPFIEGVWMLGTEKELLALF